MTGRMRTKRNALERRLGVPVRIKGGRVRDTQEER